jgi:hypothetical protein
MGERLTIEHVLKHVARFNTRDARANDDQWRAVWDARLVRPRSAGHREWTVTRTGADLLRAFNPDDVQPDQRTCAMPGDQEHDHEMCGDVVADDKR